MSCGGSRLRYKARRPVDPKADVSATTEATRGDVEIRAAVGIQKGALAEVMAGADSGITDRDHSEHQTDD